MIERIPNWRLLSWWNKSALLSGLALLVALAFILTGLVVVGSSSISLQSKSQFCLSILPLGLLMVMGIAARLQQRLNQRGGPVRQNDVGPQV